MRILLLLLLLGSLTVRAAAQTVSGPSFVDPTVRIAPGAQDGTSEISLRSPTAISSVPTITDAPLPRPLAATVTFDPIGGNSVPSNIWRYRVMISGLNFATPAQQHYALVSYDDKKDQAIPYVLSNQPSAFSWSVSKLPDPWVVSPWKPDSVCTTFAVTPRDAAATGVTINSSLVEQSTKTAITMDKFKLCIVGTDCESTQTIDLPANAIFDDQIDNWADDVQIPSSFFKIVAWRGADSLKAVGLVVDQLPLLWETRVNLGPPHDVPSVNVSQWRVAIEQIENRTGLDFGETIRNADTISTSDQPLVGAEAARPIRSLEDILA